MGCGTSTKESYSNPTPVTAANFSLKKEPEDNQPMREPEVENNDSSLVQESLKEIHPDANEELEELNRESIINCNVPSVYISNDTIKVNKQVFPFI